MTPSKAFTFITVIIAMMALFLEGCGTAPSNTSSEMPPPAPERQYSDRPQQPFTVGLKSPKFPTKANWLKNFQQKGLNVYS